MLTRKMKRLIKGLLKQIPNDKIVVMESNVTSRKDVRWLRHFPKVRAILVGAHILRAEDRAEAINELMSDNNSFSDFVSHLVSGGTVCSGCCKIQCECNIHKSTGQKGSGNE